MRYAENLCEKCSADLITGRAVKICGGIEEAQMCASCQRDFDRFIDTHPAQVEFFEAFHMSQYWMAQASWRDVEHEYRQAMRHGRNVRQELIGVIRQWLSEKTERPL